MTDARLNEVIGILLKGVATRFASGIAFLILLFLISLSNGFVLFVLLKNPLRCPRRAFSVFLAFICAIDLFVGVVVSSGEALTRFLCAFGDRGLRQEADVMRFLSYTGINSDILLVLSYTGEKQLHPVCDTANQAAGYVVEKL